MKGGRSESVLGDATRKIVHQTPLVLKHVVATINCTREATCLQQSERGGKHEHTHTRTVSEHVLLLQ